MNFNGNKSFQFEKLLNINDDEHIPHGFIFRLNGQYPYEDVFDIMVVESYDEQSGMGLMISSGYKAGLILVMLPIESGENSISVSWLKKNWIYWVYGDCPIEKIYIAEGYPVPNTPIQ